MQSCVKLNCLDTAGVELETLKSLKVISRWLHFVFQYRVCSNLKGETERAPICTAPGKLRSFKSVGMPTNGPGQLTFLRNPESIPYGLSAERPVTAWKRLLLCIAWCFLPSSASGKPTHMDPNFFEPLRETRSTFPTQGPQTWESLNQKYIVYW